MSSFFFKRGRLNAKAKKIRFINLIFCCLIFITILYIILNNSVIVIGAEIQNSVQENAIPDVQGIYNIKPTKSQKDAIDLLKKLNSNRLRAMLELDTQRTFWTYNYANAGYYQTKAKLVGIGTYCYIYVDNNYIDSVSNDMINKIIENYNNIYLTETNTFGSPPDIDNDKRINILLTDIIDGYQGSNYVAGFFDSVNEMSNVTNPTSNQCEMFYMDIIQGKPDTVDKENTFFGTLAHEFQHMIQYNVMLSNWNNEINIEDTWLDEGMSEFARYLCGYGHSKNICAYLAQPQTNLIEWNNQLSNYGASYLFILYLYDHFGINFIKGLEKNFNIGIESINDELNLYGVNMEFNTLFENWQIANLLNDASKDDGLYGYKSIDLIQERVKNKQLYNNIYPKSAINAIGSNVYTNSFVLPKYSSQYYMVPKINNYNGVNIKLTQKPDKAYVVKSKKETGISAFTDLEDAENTIEIINPEVLTSNTGYDVKGDDWDSLFLVISQNENEMNASAKINVEPEVFTQLKEDIESPLKPTGLSVLGTDYKHVDIKWNSSSDNIGVVEYDVYRDGTKINSYPIISQSIRDNNIQNAKSYIYNIKAIDLSGNISESSDNLKVDISDKSDYISPTSPVIEIKDYSEGKLRVEVTKPSIDNLAVSGYIIYIRKNGELEPSILYTINNKDEIESLNGTLLPLSEDGEFSISCCGVDSAGNLSSESNRINIKIEKGNMNIYNEAKPDFPSDFEYELLQYGGSVKLVWSKIDNAKEYNIFRNNTYLATVSQDVYTTCEYIDKDVIKDRKYIYNIETISKEDIQSFLSPNLEVMTTYKWGDVNGDGQITIDDATLIKRYVLGLVSLTEAQKLVADVSCDGKINSVDAALILRYVAKRIEKFPADK